MTQRLTSDFSIIIFPLPMKLFPNPYYLFLSAVFTIVGYTASYAQSLRLHNGALRQTMALQPGANQINICNLIPGESYTAVISGLPQDDQVIWAQTANDAKSSKSDRASVLQFKATEPCKNLKFDLKASRATEGTLSVWAKTPYDRHQKPDGTGLVVNNNQDPASLIANTLFGSSCFQVTNVTYKGMPQSFGSFTGGQSNIQLANGIVIATGDAHVVQGPNTDENASQGYGIPGSDPDLLPLTTGSLFDIASIEFDITPTVPVISLQMVFGSEEYCEYVNTQFNDVFGIFISGPGYPSPVNIAKVPNTNQPVSVNTINHLINTNYYINNGSYNTQCPSLPPFAPQECQLDGWTKALTASAQVLPCSTYHIKIAIADVGDGIYDSAVFLHAAGTNPGAGAFVKPNIEYPDNQVFAYEGCHNGSIRFSRVNTDISTPQTVNFTVSGTATPGVDYAALTSPVVIPAGATFIVVPVVTYADALAETDETIVLNVANACDCGLGLTYTIKNVQPFSASLTDDAGCMAALLAPVVQGGAGPYTYAWSDGSKANNLLVNTPGTKTYTVTVSDLCGKTAVLSGKATAYTAPGPIHIQFCTGTSATFNGQTYNHPDTIVYHAPGQNGQCDTSTIVYIDEVQQFSRTKQIELCTNQSYTAGGNTYYPPATFQLLQPGANGACDTLTTYELMPAPGTFHSDTIHLCVNQIYTFEGVNYTAPATLTHTYPGQNGACDTLVRHILQLAKSHVAVQCPGNITVTAVSATSITYDAPVASSDCTCPDINYTQTSGFQSGHVFQFGETLNCFTAKDACGNTTTCCFLVTVAEQPPCDTKESGCIKWEILSITLDAESNKTYKIRITNNCPNRLQYADFQVPDGIQAVAPANQSVYTSPAGRNYLVTNPNFSPFYSIRFAPQQPGINNGNSDIFEYTLPPQADVAFILAIVRLSPYTWLTAHLNTHGCAGGHQRVAAETPASATMRLFPNPTSGSLMVDIPAADGETAPVRVIDERGACVFRTSVPAGSGPQPILLPDNLTDGVYVLEVQTAGGKPERLLFILRR